MKKKNFKVILFLVVAVVVNLSAQNEIETGSFIDSRDGRKYQTVTIDSLIWMTENLCYSTERSHCPNFSKSIEECANGNYYRYEESHEVCPDGFRLPYVHEFENYLMKMLLFREVNKDTIYFEKFGIGIGSWMFDESYSTDIFNEPNLIKLSNSGLIQGKKFKTRKGAHFWLRALGSEEKKYHYHIHQNFFSAHFHKHHLDVKKARKRRKLSVRCVKRKTK